MPINSFSSSRSNSATTLRNLLTHHDRAKHQADIHPSRSTNSLTTGPEDHRINRQQQQALNQIDQNSNTLYLQALLQQAGRQARRIVSENSAASAAQQLERDYGLMNTARGRNIVNVIQNNPTLNALTYVLGHIGTEVFKGAGSAAILATVIGAVTGQKQDFVQTVIKQVAKISSLTSSYDFIGRVLINYGYNGQSLQRALVLTQRQLRESPLRIFGDLDPLGDMSTLTQQLIAKLRRYQGYPPNPRR